MQKKLKDLVLKYSYLSQIGQVGCSLSVVDLIWCLYDSVLNVKSDDFINNNNERDKFIESKGHAGLALFIVLHLNISIYNTVPPRKFGIFKIK